MILIPLIDNSFYFISLVLIVLSILPAYYYLRISKLIFFLEKKGIILLSMIYFKQSIIISLLLILNLCLIFSVSDVFICSQVMDLDDYLRIRFGYRRYIPKDKYEYPPKPEPSKANLFKQSIKGSIYVTYYISLFMFIDLSKINTTANKSLGLAFVGVVTIDELIERYVPDDIGEETLEKIKKFLKKK